MLRRACSPAGVGRRLSTPRMLLKIPSRTTGNRLLAPFFEGRSCVIGAGGRGGRVWTISNLDSAGIRCGRLSLDFLHGFFRVN